MGVCACVCMKRKTRERVKVGNVDGVRNPRGRPAAPRTKRTALGGVGVEATEFGSTMKTCFGDSAIILRTLRLKPEGGSHTQ